MSLYVKAIKNINSPIFNSTNTIDVSGFDFQSLYTELFKDLIDCEAIRIGHFKLRSGNHSSFYLKFSHITAMNLLLCDAICKDLAYRIYSHYGDNNIDIILSPAMGAIIPGSKVASVLLSENLMPDLKFVYCEKKDDKFVLQRGYDKLVKGKNVLIIEDVMTTGGSAKKAIECALEHGANIVGIASFFKRSSHFFNDQTFEGKKIIFDCNLKQVVEKKLDDVDPNTYIDITDAPYQSSDIDYPIMSILNINAPAFSEKEMPKYLKNTPITSFK